MILLDTNVVSAVMAPSPPAEVIAWLDRQPTSTLHLSTISVAEIGYGIAILPAGRRREDLARRFERFVADGFAQRVLAFDEAAATLYGPLMAHRRAIGRPIAAFDGQIAAIARAHRCSLATRNVRDFEACDLDLIDPFAAT